MMRLVLEEGACGLQSCGYWRASVARTIEVESGGKDATYRNSGNGCGKVFVCLGKGLLRVSLVSSRVLKGS
jgi:hypothetical protein